MLYASRTVPGQDGQVDASTHLEFFPQECQDSTLQKPKSLTDLTVAGGDLGCLAHGMRLDMDIEGFMDMMNQYSTVTVQS